MDCMKHEFYHRQIAGWPILQQDEDSQILILGSESCVVSPLGGRGSCRTGQHREHQEIMGSNSRAAEVVMVDLQAGIQKPWHILGRS